MKRRKEKRRKERTMSMYTVGKTEPSRKKVSIVEEDHQLGVKIQQITLVSTPSLS